MVITRIFVKMASVLVFLLSVWAIIDKRYEDANYLILASIYLLLSYLIKG
jgi:hypothetical protein